MTFRPKNNSKKELILAVITGAAAAILFLLSGIVSKFIVVYQISALLLAVFAVEVYIKYVGNDYVYEAAEKSLKVYRITGKKSICVCSLDYEMSLSHVVSCKEYLSNKADYPKTAFNVNYMKDLKPESYYVYFFTFNEKKSMMKFEPDSIFVEYVNDKISKALDGADNDEN